MSVRFEDYLKTQNPEVVARAREEADKILLEIHLAELRKKAEFTQSMLAEAMGVKQPTVAGMEKEGKDIKLTTLKKYIESMGCKASVNVELPDGSHYGFNI